METPRSAEWVIDQCHLLPELVQRMHHREFYIRRNLVVPPSVMEHELFDKKRLRLWRAMYRQQTLHPHISEYLHHYLPGWHIGKLRYGYIRACGVIERAYERLTQGLSFYPHFNVPDQIPDAHLLNQWRKYATNDDTEYMNHLHPFLDMHLPGWRCSLGERPPIHGQFGRLWLADHHLRQISSSCT